MKTTFESFEEATTELKRLCSTGIIKKDWLNKIQIKFINEDDGARYYVLELSNSSNKNSFIKLTRVQNGTKIWLDAFKIESLEESISSYTDEHPTTITMNSKDIFEVKESMDYIFRLIRCCNIIDSIQDKADET